MHIGANVVSRERVTIPKLTQFNQRNLEKDPARRICSVPCTTNSIFLLWRQVHLLKHRSAQFCQNQAVHQQIYATSEIYTINRYILCKINSKIRILLREAFCYFLIKDIKGDCWDSLNFQRTLFTARWKNTVANHELMFSGHRQCYVFKTVCMPYNLFKITMLGLKPQSPERNKPTKTKD